MLTLIALTLSLSSHAEIGSKMVGHDAQDVRVTNLSYKSVIVGMRMQSQSELPSRCSSSWDTGSECMIRQVPVWKKTLVATVEYNSDFDKVGLDNDNDTNRLSSWERNASVEIPVPEKLLSQDILSQLKKRSNRKLAESLFVTAIEKKERKFSKVVYGSCDYTSEGDAVRCRDPKEVIETHAVNFITLRLKN